MPLVNVTVNQRTYAIACDEGEEEHLGELAAYVDTKVEDLLKTVGQVGEQRLLLMAALLIADTHFEKLALLEKRSSEIAALTESKENLARRLAQLEEQAVVALDGATNRLDELAVRVGRA
jgi:cell division protein ZapA